VIHTDDVDRVNKNGEFVYIKYHFIADHGQKQFTAEEAIQICGEDPDFSKRDLYRAIEKKKLTRPHWDLIHSMSPRCGPRASSRYAQHLDRAPGYCH
jgi:catalase